MHSHRHTRAAPARKSAKMVSSNMVSVLANYDWAKENTAGRLAQNAPRVRTDAVLRRLNQHTRTMVLHVYRFDSVRILFSGGEEPQTTGNSLGKLTQRILVNQHCQNNSIAMIPAPVMGNHLSDATCLPPVFFKSGE